MIDKDTVREVFLRNGFTIKEGHDDLKDYVYAAANELLSLYTAPPAAAPAVHIGFDPAGGDEKTVIVHHVAPPGWKLVPVEPTKEMVDAALKFPAQTKQQYNAMLAAAPSPSDTL